MTITIPIPPRILSPNVTIGSIGGRMAKATAIKKQRELARLVTLEALNGEKPMLKIAHIYITWFSKTAREIDRDNLQGILKSTFDGMADAGLFDNDKGLVYWPIERNKDAKNPRVEIEIMNELEQQNKITDRTLPRPISADDRRILGRLLARVSAQSRAEEREHSGELSEEIATLSAVLAKTE